MIRINSVIALPEELDTKIRAISADTNIALDFTTRGMFKVTVKCKIGREIYGAMSKNSTVADLSTIISSIEDCISTICELKNTGISTSTVTELSDDYLKVDLAEAIRVDRARRRLTLTEYAKFIGVPPGTLTGYENGRYKPRDPAVLKRIIDYTNNKAI
jgi:DNA-binding transcriptional regulator YiaG